MRIKPRAIATVLCMIFFIGFAVCGVVRSTDKEASEIKQSYQVLAEAEPVIMADLLMESPNLTPEVEKEPDYPLTQEEIDLIALVTMGEAEGETELGKHLVIDTILNRIDHPSFPDTVYDSTVDAMLDSRRKRHITGGILLSAALLFGGLAITVVTIQTDEEEYEDE